MPEDPDLIIKNKWISNIAVFCHVLRAGFPLFLGGNTDLQGFVPRLSSDLRDRLPEQAAVINISPFPNVGG
jgi:hypothetical protein